MTWFVAGRLLGFLEPSHRLIELILRHRHLGARELQEKILEELGQFSTSEFNDDVTLVVIAAQ